MADSTIHERRFRAMGSACRIIVAGTAPGLDAELEHRVHELESRWSRFLPDSEISALNATGGPMLVSPDTLRLVRTSVEAHRLTDGLFDPLLLRPLEALGYDRDHRALDVTRSPVTIEPTDIVPTPVGPMQVDDQLGSVELPPGTGFDPGGIGKGIAADIVAEEGSTAGATGVLVELGGDLRVRGTWVDGGPWPVVITHPIDPDRDLTTIMVAGGGVATSSTLRRRWRHDGTVRHHVLDPVTAAPTPSDLLAVTVHAGSAWAADVLAKAAIIAGRARAAELLAPHGVNAVLVGTDGDRTDLGTIIEQARAA